MEIYNVVEVVFFMKYRFLIFLLISSSLPLFGQVNNSILPCIKEINIPLQHEHQKLRVMTYNMLYNKQDAEEKLPIKHRWDQRKARLLEYLAYAKADLIGSQELQEDQLYEFMQDFGKWYQYYGMKTRENEGRSDTNAIFFNPKRLELIEAQTIPYERHLGENAFTYCRFRDKFSNQQFVVLNIKLTYGLSWSSKKKRFTEASELSQFIKGISSDDPILIMGDFNIFPLFDGDFIENIFKHTLKDTKQLAHFGRFGPNCTITNSCFLFTPFTGPELYGFVPDHIIVNDRVQVLTYGVDPARVDGEFPSDHFPVIVDLRFNP